MNASELSREMEGKTFRYKGKDHRFYSCKDLNAYIMVTTDRETFQLLKSGAGDFLDEILVIETHAGPLAPAPLERNYGLEVLKSIERPKTFEKLNRGFEKLLEEMDDPEADLEVLEKKSRILTAMGQTAIGMEQANISLLKLTVALNNG